jgi:[protein-PII] uridylyltransferase
VGSSQLGDLIGGETEKSERQSATLDKARQLVRTFVASRQALIEEDLHRGSGIRTTRRYADLMDGFIRALFIAAGFTARPVTSQDDGLAVVALGSYGRRELCLASDVDLTLIYRGRPSPAFEKNLARALYPLWDAKLEVGYSVRTVSECIRLAVSDFQVLTSLIDGRFLSGSRSVYRLFEDAFWSRIFREKAAFLKHFVIYRQEKTEKYGREDYFVEPDIKEGLGGLRDLHVMSWMARIYFRCQRVSHLARYAAFAHFGFRELGLSRSFLLRLRNHLHLLSGRKEDRLLLSDQDELSRSLGYQDSRYGSVPEKFMRDLHLHLNRVRYGHEEFLLKALDIIDPSPQESPPKRLPSPFQLVKGNIAVRTGWHLEKDPMLILRALSEANRRGLFLDSSLIWEARKIIACRGKDLISSPEARDCFLGLILKPKTSRILRLALEIGLITLFIPEFRRIRNLAELGFYHVETVDLHSLACLETLHRISAGAYDGRWPILKKTLVALKHPDGLLLAALLHDIGKGFGGEHAEKGAQRAPKILKRLGCDNDALRVVPLLVRHHLLLAQVAQHRDLNEEKTAVQVAQTVQDKEILLMLFLLTVADSFSTGPIACTEWKIILLVELFIKVRHILERGLLASPDATNLIEQQKKTILERLTLHFPEADILDLFDQISSRYFVNTNLEDMVRHFHLALSMEESGVAWSIQKLTEAPVTRIILCTHDKPGLFAKMVGVFTLNNVSVLSVQIFTLKNGLAFDTYEVTNPPDPYREEERWAKIRKEVGLAMEDRLPLDDMLMKKKRRALRTKNYQKTQTKQVRVNNEASDFFTVLEVRARAGVELLHRLANTIFSLGLDIRFAKFNSDQEKMSGDFYVRDTFGQKVLEPAQIKTLRKKLMDVIR